MTDDQLTAALAKVREMRKRAQAARRRDKSLYSDEENAEYAKQVAEGRAISMTEDELDRAMKFEEIKRLAKMEKRRKQLRKSSKRYYKRNKETIIAKLHERRAANRDAINEHRRERYAYNRKTADKARASSLKYYHGHKEELNAKRRAKYAENSEYDLAKSREYRLLHREERNIKQRAYYAEHRAEILAKAKQRYAADPEKYRARSKVNEAKRRAKLKAQAKDAPRDTDSLHQDGGESKKPPQGYPYPNIPIANLTPEQLEERRTYFREYARKWRAKNPEKKRANYLRWRKSHLEEDAARHRAYRAAHREELNAKRRKPYARTKK